MELQYQEDQILLFYKYTKEYFNLQIILFGLKCYLAYFVVHLFILKYVEAIIFNCDLCGKEFHPNWTEFDAKRVAFARCLVCKIVNNL